MVLCRCFLLGILLPLLFLLPLDSQTTTPDTSNSALTFQAKVRVVVVDVVVTDRKDEPVAGLPKEDFQISEDGHPQTVSFFEEHKGVPPVDVKLPPMPPNQFTNFPVMKSADSVNVLLLDALNTPLQNQAFVHSELLKHLKEIPPGSRIAIFTLSSRLRLVQPVTTDTSVLLASLNNKNAGGDPQASLLLRTSPDSNADRQATSQMEDLGAQASADSLRQFLAERNGFETGERISMTLQAMQQLARYLSAIPGRKNVLWFSGSFPINIFPDADLSDSFDVMRQYGGEVQKTSDLLTGAQVSVYPIAAEGLAGDQLDEASSFPVGVTNGQQATEYQNRELRNGSIERNANHITMDELARDTGGEAFYNTNGLNDAVNRVIKNGSRYYTLTYTPTDARMDGGYRHIRVKLRDGNYALAYRRGYYAEDSKTPKAAKRQPAPRHPEIDPLQQIMGPGLPDFTQVVYMIRVLAKPVPAGERAGDNVKLKGPVTRYTVDFAIPVEDVKFETTVDGMRHGSIEVSLYVYDHDGDAVNWLTRKTEMDLKPELFAAYQKGGLQVNQVIDVPTGDFYLRTGVYDPGSKNAGTLEIPLNRVIPSVSAAK